MNFPYFQYEFGKPTTACAGSGLKVGLAVRGMSAMRPIPVVQVTVARSQKRSFASGPGWCPCEGGRRTGS